MSGVDVLNGQSFPQPAFLGVWPKELHGYAKKVFSLYSSSFAEVEVVEEILNILPSPILYMKISVLLSKADERSHVV